MNKKIDNPKNKSRRPARPQHVKGRKEANIHNVHPKGTMREPPQTPGAEEAEGELREVREALHEVEETVGDWSKGG